MRQHHGFTLLEVMIALAILSVSLMVIVRSQGQTVMLKTQEEQILVATHLVRTKMVDLEIQFEQDGWSSMEEEECGDFKDDFDDLFDRFEWCYVLEKVELSIPGGLFGGMFGEGEGEGESAGMGTADLASSMGIDLGTAMEQLSEGLRQLKVEVKWKEGGDEQSIGISTHLVNLTRAQVL